MTFPWDKKDEGLKRGQEAFGSGGGKTKFENARTGPMEAWERNIVDHAKLLREIGKDSSLADKSWSELSMDVQVAISDALSEEAGQKTDMGKFRLNDGAGAGGGPGSGSNGAGQSGSISSASTGYQSAEKTTTAHREDEEKMNSKCAACNALSESEWSDKCGTCGAAYEGEKDGSPMGHREKDNGLAPLQGEPWDAEMYKDDLGPNEGVRLSNAGQPLDEKTKSMVRDWLEKHNGDREGLAKWMRDSLRLGSISECREIIDETVGERRNDAAAPGICECGHAYGDHGPEDEGFLPCKKCKCSSYHKNIKANASSDEKWWEVSEPGARYEKLRRWGYPEKRAEEEAVLPLDKLPENTRKLLATENSAERRNAGHVAAEMWAIASQDERGGWLMQANQKVELAKSDWINLSIDVQVALQDAWDMPESMNNASGCEWCGSDKFASAVVVYEAGAKVLRSLCTKCCDKAKRQGAFERIATEQDKKTMNNAGDDVSDDLLDREWYDMRGRLPADIGAKAVKDKFGKDADLWSRQPQDVKDAFKAHYKKKFRNNAKDWCLCGHSQANHDNNGIGDSTGCLTCGFDAEGCKKFRPGGEERRNANEPICPDCLRKAGSADNREGFKDGGVVHLVEEMNTDHALAACGKRSSGQGVHELRKNADDGKPQVVKEAEDDYAIFVDGKKVREGLHQGEIEGAMAEVKQELAERRNAVGDAKYTWDGLTQDRRNEWLERVGKGRGGADGNKILRQRWDELPSDVREALEKSHEMRNAEDGACANCGHAHDGDVCDDCPCRIFVGKENRNVRDGESTCPKSYSGEHVWEVESGGPGLMIDGHATGYHKDGTVLKCELCGKTKTKVAGTLGKFRENSVDPDGKHWPDKCPCGGDWKDYDGALGYQSRVCRSCGKDINDVPGAGQRRNSRLDSDPEYSRLVLEEDRLTKRLQELEAKSGHYAALRDMPEKQDADYKKADADLRAVEKKLEEMRRRDNDAGGDIEEIERHVEGIEHELGEMKEETMNNSSVKINLPKGVGGETAFDGKDWSYDFEADELVGDGKRIPAAQLPSEVLHEITKQLKGRGNSLDNKDISKSEIGKEIAHHIKDKGMEPEQAVAAAFSESRHSMENATYSEILDYARKLKADGTDRTEAARLLKEKFFDVNAEGVRHAVDKVWAENANAGDETILADRHNGLEVGAAKYGSRKNAEDVPCSKCGKPSGLNYKPSGNAKALCEKCWDEEAERLLKAADKK